MAIYNSADSNQIKAIEATDGPLLIIAGPGSGKTFTIVERIVYLITVNKVPPESLLVVTFTDKAASELTTRISNRLNDLDIRFNLNEMYLGTFHSICLRLIDEHREFTRLRRNFTMLDQFDQQYFLYQKIYEYKKIPDHGMVLGEGHSPWMQSETLLKWVNKVSEEALDAGTLAKAQEPQVRTLAACFELYQQQLQEANALDFSGIQYEALKLLQEHPQVLAELRAKITYMMVDEYQDTNTIQERILKLLTNDSQNLCVVGDDDQGLYRFRGATIRNILEFPTLFRDGQCKQVTLTTNYRSHPEIINFYNEWIQGQTWTQGGKKFRFDKVIEPRRQDFPAVPSVIKISAPEDGDWKEETLAFLRKLKESGKLTDWNQVAFLFRSVKSDPVVALAEYLEEHDIPVYSPRSNMFFDREEIRLMIGALIFLFPQFPDVRKWSDDAHLKIWDYFDYSCFKPFAEELRKPENERLLRWVRSKAKQHLNLVQNADYSFSGLFYELLQFPLFSQYLSATGVLKVPHLWRLENVSSSILQPFS
jgi:DNA helicase-2/ATP-dependent DNA helicase PcrA